jgi:hypothetical protein
MELPENQSICEHHAHCDEHACSLAGSPLEGPALLLIAQIRPRPSPRTASSKSLRDDFPILRLTRRAFVPGYSISIVVNAGTLHFLGDCKTSLGGCKAHTPTSSLRYELTYVS